MKSNSQMNDKALDIMADIFDPFCDLLADKEFNTLFLTDFKKAVSYACKNHKDKVVEIAAAIDGIPVEEYKVNPFILPIKLMMVIGAYTKETRDLFPSQSQSMDETSSGSAMANTEANDLQKDS